MPTHTSTMSLRAFQAVLLLSGVMGLPALVVPARGAESESADAMPRVRISQDGTQFVLDGTNEKFFPWGFNYLGRADHLAEDDWHTDAGWQKIDTDFREMRKLGANVVRWHLQLETIMEGPEQVDAGQVARLKELLKLARKHTLYLDITGLNCFRRERIPEWYDSLGEADRWAVQARFWSAVADACAGDPVVFCYDLMNEPIITEARKDEHPWVGGELGGFYFVQRICNQPKGRDSREIAAAWVRQQVDAIRQHDRQTLTTVGIIPWAFVWPNAKPVFYTPQTAKYLDFVSIHVYPKSKELEKERAALAVYDLGKPLVVEETFPLACSIDELSQFMDAASGRVDGWVSHYFGHTPPEERDVADIKAAVIRAFLEFWTKKRSDLIDHAPPQQGTDD